MILFHFIELFITFLHALCHNLLNLYPKVRLTDACYFKMALSLYGIFITNNDKVSAYTTIQLSYLNC